MTERFLKKTPRDVFWLSILFGVPLFIWLYSILTELNKRLPQEKRVPILLFQIPLFYLLAYLPVGFVLLIGNYVSIDIILLFHFSAMLSIFFVMLLASVSIRRFEKYKHLKPSNGIMLFLGIWYYVFGVWSIQPKLNKYVKYEVLKD